MIPLAVFRLWLMNIKIFHISRKLWNEIKKKKPKRKNGHTTQRKLITLPNDFNISTNAKIAKMIQTLFPSMHTIENYPNERGIPRHLKKKLTQVRKRKS